MNKIVFLDTETTGKDKEDRLCQIAWKLKDGELFSFLFKPPLEISIEAMAIHHITNKMVNNMDSFKDWMGYEKFKKELEDDDTVVVAHNAKFDLAMLAKEDIVPKKHICTLKVTRALDGDAKLEKFSLQYLRYLLDLDVEAIAHNAGGDVIVLEALFERLLKKTTAGKMIEISLNPSVIRRFAFGKHKGKLVSDVAKDDIGYLQWLWGEKQKEEEPDEDWIYTLKLYLEI